MKKQILFFFFLLLFPFFPSEQARAKAFSDSWMDDLQEFSVVKDCDGKLSMGAFGAFLTECHGFYRQIRIISL